jgi:alpha-ribazole phosphatase CobZ
LKNRKNKVKAKKRTEELFDNVKLHSDYDYFFMENPDYFLTFSDGTNRKNQINNGIDIVENIIVLSQDYNDEDSFKKSLDYFKKKKQIKENFNEYNSYNSYIAQEYPMKNTDTIENIDTDNNFDNLNNATNANNKDNTDNNKNTNDKSIDNDKNRHKNRNRNIKKNKRDGNNEINYFIEKSDNIAIMNFMNNNLNLIKITDNLQVAKVKRGSETIELDLSQIIYINKNLDLKELINLYKIAIETKIKYFEYLKLPEHIQEALNNNESVILACKAPIGFKKGKSQDLFNLVRPKSSAVNNSEKPMKINEDIGETEKELVTSMVKSCSKSLKKINLSFGILDYIIAEGITIDSLIEAGMELCVGIEETPEKINELKLKLKKQILKSLEDINVVALLMSAIRCEEDFQSNRLREIDVSDDPAYLYTDEVLGIAIANQIAGTKATFNFKRYDEEKPGIISVLGPMVDDIFAGLIAGCMSKIFEEDY